MKAVKYFKKIAQLTIIVIKYLNKRFTRYINGETIPALWLGP